jgi:hypothetical protein
MLPPMNWERRLREMILAGGALAASACDGSTSAAQIDPASNGVSAEGGDSGDDAPDCVSGGTPCCNADPDPCCSMLSCLGYECRGAVGPDNPVYLSCEARYQCEDFMNGIYTQEPDGSLVCVPRGIVVDASAGPTDADADAAEACAPSGCATACPAGTHDVSSVVNGCTVWQCCVSDDGAGPDAAADASPE